MPNEAEDNSPEPLSRKERLEEFFGNIEELTQTLLIMAGTSADEAALAGAATRAAVDEVLSALRGNPADPRYGALFDEALLAHTMVQRGASTYEDAYLGLGPGTADRVVAGEIGWRPVARALQMQGLS